MNSADKLWELKKLEYKRDAAQSDVSCVEGYVKLGTMDAHREVRQRISEAVSAGKYPTKIEDYTSDIDWSTQFDDDLKEKRKVLDNITSTLS